MREKPIRTLKGYEAKGFKIDNYKFNKYLFDVGDPPETFIATFAKKFDLFDLWNGIFLIKLNGIKIDPQVKHQIIVNWQRFINQEGSSSSFSLKGDFDKDDIYKESASLIPLDKKITVDLNSPGQLHIVDDEGRITGLSEGEIKEDIPYSLYDAEEKIAIIFSDEDLRDDGLMYNIIGTDEDVYGLTISSEVGEEEFIEFSGLDIPTTPNQLHQYQVDWDALAQGEKAVTLQIDKEGDGVFEQTIQADATLEPPKAEAGGPYEGSEGSAINFDASASSDHDGQIVLYEWDFDGDGVYEAHSTAPTIEYAWGDDYQGVISLRITDDENLTSVDTANVTIKNVVPIAEAGNNQEVYAGDTVQFNGSFTDLGSGDTHTIEWDFGDETVAGEARLTPVHIYYRKGIYNIILTVEDDDRGVGFDALQIIVKPVPAKIDFDPDTLNLKSSGKYVTTYIELPEKYNVKNIDISTVLFNNSVHALSEPIEIGDYNNNKITDLMVKFNRAEVQNILNVGENIIAIAGEILYNEHYTDFSGDDVIKVINNKK